MNELERYIHHQEYERKLQKEEQELRDAVISEQYLWDMQCWNRYKDPQEIRQWIRNDFQPNNAGHVVHCLRELVKKFSYTIEDIIRLVLQNHHKCYENRLVKCFQNPEACPHLQECNGNYSVCHIYCKQCDSIPMD